MAEYKRDYYTRTFVDMLTTLELELVRYDDGIGIRDMYDEGDFGERFDDAIDVVDYISGEIDDNVMDGFLSAIQECDLKDDWERHCDNEFTYENMLSFMDEHKDFKGEYQFLFYEPTDMLLKHLDDVDLDLAMELTQERYMDYNLVFAEMLEDLQVELDKDGDVFTLFDRNTDTFIENIGGTDFMEAQRQLACQMLVRMETSINSFYLENLENAFDEAGFEEEMPQTPEEWVCFMNEHRDFKEEYRHAYDVMNMVAYRYGRVDLNSVLKNEFTLSAQKDIRSGKTDKDIIER